MFFQKNAIRYAEKADREGWGKRNQTDGEITGIFSSSRVPVNYYFRKNPFRRAEKKRIGKTGKKETGRMRKNGDEKRGKTCDPEGKSEENQRTYGISRDPMV